MTDSGSLLWQIFLVITVAKAAAELAERLRIPVVVGEISAGIALGPSLLGWVDTSEVMSVLGELGVILLLLEVGLQMELGELARVGRASLLVAVVGIALPFAGGLGVGLFFGESVTTSVFLGAALTATSVGITARVFSELRALARVEARTVLGAAVADDVLGLVILTVVVKAVSSGTISALQVLGVLALAIGFLCTSILVGKKLVPLFAFVRISSRSPGTLTSLFLAFALGFAVFASAAGLAPVVGAFVAGLCVAGTDHSERMRAALAPLGHVFIPIFFLQIGIQAEIGRFLDRGVILLGIALLSVAVIGKILAAAGAVGSPGDKPLIGLGMIPRGEVGLIFAGLGLRSGLLSADLYAALLLVVLATTLLAPPALRLRLDRLKKRDAAVLNSHGKDPLPGWSLEVQDGEVKLQGDPPVGRDLEVILRASILATNARPGSRLLDWISELGRGALSWDARTKAYFFDLLRTGNLRSWKLLEMSGVLGRALPELDDALRRRISDRTQLDPSGALRMALVERLRETIASSSGGPAAEEFARLKDPRRLFLAALVLEVFRDEGLILSARKLVQRLDLGAGAEQDVALLAGSSELLIAAARKTQQPPGEVLKIAAHLRDDERTRALFILTMADPGHGFASRVRIEHLFRAVLRVLATSKLTSRASQNLVSRRVAEALRIAGDDHEVKERIASAPSAYALSVEPEEMLRHARLLSPLPSRGSLRTEVQALPSGLLRIEVGGRDRRGLLACTSQILERVGFEIETCLAATWDDGGALQTFVGRGQVPSIDRLNEALESNLRARLTSVGVPEVAVAFDQDSSPWYTVCTVRGRDEPGLLHAVAASIAAAGGIIHSATASTSHGAISDVLEVSDESGEKLSVRVQELITLYLKEGVITSQRRRSWKTAPKVVAMRPKKQAAL